MLNSVVWLKDDFRTINNPAISSLIDEKNGIKNYVNSFQKGIDDIVQEQEKDIKIKSNLSEDNKLQWPGGIYYVDGFIDPHELSFISYYFLIFFLC